MKTLEAIYEHGQVKFLKQKPPAQKYKVLVTFLEEISANAE